MRVALLLIAIAVAFASQHYDDVASFKEDELPSFEMVEVAADSDAQEAEAMAAYHKVKAATQKAVSNIKGEEKDVLQAAQKEEKAEDALVNDEEDEEDQVEQLKEEGVDPTFIKELQHHEAKTEKKAMNAMNKDEKKAEKEEKIAEKGQNVALKKAGVDTTVLEVVVGNSPADKKAAKKKAAAAKKAKQAEKKQEVKEEAKKKQVLSHEVGGVPIKPKKGSNLGVLHKEQAEDADELHKAETEEAQVKAAMKMISSGKKGHFELRLPEFALQAKNKF